ncbi:GATA-type zinc finger protein 1-like isoform X1 [Haliotis rufescens]|uniref:GATA-type zinc finger protein 1-like isoform X1 n=1 Tax=Haliotis rufescens TaxID=6454 RepID=UPI001EAFBB0B|nr:GATA-type zinc finger protein 1-like isoform X1 [Haliotis rufescens]
MKTDYQPFFSANVSQCSRMARKDTGSPCKSLMETDSVKRAADCSVKPKHIDSGQDTHCKNRSPKAGDGHVLTHTQRENSKDGGGGESWGTRSATPRSRRKARKPKKPQKSAACWDPNFRGVTMWFTTLVEGDRTQLRISSFFSKATGKKKTFMGTKCPRKRNDSVSECKSSSENEDFRETFPTMNFGAKVCASCGTRRTPLWRDAEDGTPLCNACGIRYRKYRVRCSKCWHIPKKDSKTYPSCSVCGGMLRFHQNRKLW